MVNYHHAGKIESSQPFTIKFEYFPKERKAHTIHYTQDGNIDTYTFADSLMRAVQTKQTGVVWNGGSAFKVSIVSGRETKYEYDLLGRKLMVSHPDAGETDMTYNAAGQVESLTSSKQGKESTIVAQIGYDKDGHTVYQKLGNGTETTYTYDKQRERLQDMTLTGSGSTLMQNKYRYDAVDNTLKAMWQSALTGAVSGAISGGIESYENCKDNGVNPFTGL